MDPSELAAIARRLRPDGHLIRHWRLPGGLSAQMRALELRDSSGDSHRLVVRWYAEPRERLAREASVLKLVRAAGIPAPAPLLLDESGQITPLAYLVLSFVPGKMAFAPADRQTHVQQLGRQLALIHRLTASRHDLSFLPPATGCAELSQRRTSPDEGLQETALRALLGQLPKPPASSEPTLLHGDFWPGNSLWLAGQLQAVIDWEDAAVGDPLIDLARSRLETALIFGCDALTAFMAAYRAARPFEERGLAYWDLCAALRFVRLAGGDLAGMASYFHDFDRPDISAASLQSVYEHFVAAARQQLD